MAQYLTGVPKGNLVGRQAIKVVITSGTVTMEIKMSQDDPTFEPMTDGFFDTVGTTTKQVTLPECSIQFIMSGTATVYMQDVE
jgi:hypothetical protein